MSIRDLGEFGFIARIAERVRNAPDVAVGIGDDAAVLLPPPGEVTLVTSDMLLEGVHFDLSFTDPYRLGRKSLAVNLSDIAAMGGRPRHAFLSFGIPSRIDLDFLQEFVTGFLDLADEHGVTLAGGDTCSSRGDFIVSVTLSGTQVREKTVTRNGARSGDLVCVTGFLGDSALGLEELRRGRRESPAIDRHLDPAPRVATGLLLADMDLPTAMIDVSDGTIADLGHILELSEAGAVIRAAALPVSPYFAASAGELSEAPLGFALSGGEDYELLFTIPPSRMEELETVSAQGVPVSVIGEIVEKPGLAVVGRDGSPLELPRQGFDHFRKSSSRL